MTQLYNRAVTLYVGDTAGNGLDLSEMQIKFDTRNGDFQTPNTCTIRVYNLSAATTQQLKAKEFTTVVLKAGYVGNFGIIFSGQIRYVYVGHETNIDSYIDIVAADGDAAYNFSVINTSLAAGSTPAQQLAAISNATAPQGVTAAASQPPLPTTGLPRGKVMFVMAKDYMRILADTVDATWSIDNGQIQLDLQTSYLPGEVIELNYNTGLVGFPEETLNGLIVRCLLNPYIFYGRIIKLNNDRINPAHLDININTQLQQGFLDQMANKDGLYKVFVVEHSGDTRGNSYFTKMICIGVNGTVPPNSNLAYKKEISPYGS